MEEKLAEPSPKIRKVTKGKTVVQPVEEKGLDYLDAVINFNHLLNSFHFTEN